MLFRSKPVSSPYESAIYANGIVESDQPSGENINIFPEVSGPITQVLVREGQQVSAGTPLFSIDDSVQRATTEQLRLQAEASLALLNELKASNPEATFEFMETEISLMKNVDHACDKIKFKEKKVDILFMSPGYLSFDGRQGVLR